MRVVLQRVTRARVRVGDRVTGEIGSGLLLLVGFAPGDGSGELEWMANKVVGLRVFNDADGRMNESLEAVGGGILAVSQFTLHGDARKGRRPSFVGAAPPERAERLWDRFVVLLRERAPGGPESVQTGEFGAMMRVELLNDGPVTLILERGEGDE